ncbi:hypothetical protein BC567DRAFT_18521 [Phyllosticta citribraziliensis]
MGWTRHRSLWITYLLFWRLLLPFTVTVTHSHCFLKRKAFILYHCLCVLFAYVCRAGKWRAGCGGDGQIYVDGKRERLDPPGDSAAWIAYRRAVIRRSGVVYTARGDFAGTRSRRLEVSNITRVVGFPLAISVSVVF